MGIDPPSILLQHFVNPRGRLFTGRKRPPLDSRPVPPRHPFLVALEPVADALGATVVPASRVSSGDVPLQWEGELVGGLRLPGVHGTLDRMIASVEAQLGAPLAELSREDKQHAVRLLDERGAFQLRKAVEEVADALSVSRFTVYNYLNAGAR
jgi:hypothetical protein